MSTCIVHKKPLFVGLHVSKLAGLGYLHVAFTCVGNLLIQLSSFVQLTLTVRTCTNASLSRIPTRKRFPGHTFQHMSRWHLLNVWKTMWLYRAQLEAPKASLLLWYVKFANILCPWWPLVVLGNLPISILLPDWLYTTINFLYIHCMQKDGSYLLIYITQTCLSSLKLLRAFLNW